MDEHVAARDALDDRLQSVIDAFANTGHEDSGFPGGELGEALRRAPSEDWVRGGVREQRFFLVDEPERHLHPRLQRAAASWLASTTSERHAPCLLATHSAPFLSLNEASYVQVTREGEQIGLRAMDLSDVKQLDELAVTMGFDRGELLTLVNLWLVVEGLTEQRALEALFPGELRAAGIEVVPLHGTSKWQAVLDSDALWRFTTAKVALLFDNIQALKIEEMLTMSVEELGALRKSNTEPNEVKDLSNLMGSLARQGRTLTPIANPEPDLLNHLDDASVKRIFPDYPGHVAAETAFAAQGKGRKEFLRKAYGVERSADAFREIAGDMQQRDLKPEGLRQIVLQCTELAMGDAADS